MKNKLYVIFLTLLMCLTVIVIVPEDLEVEAGSGGTGEEDGIGLDYDFMWNVTENLSRVVHDVYPQGEDVIRKGRAFGTDGDRWTANYTRDILEDLDLENVDKIPIGPIQSKKSWYYTSKLETINFNLTLDDHPTQKTQPKNETFTFPSARPDNVNNQMNYNYTFTNEKIKSSILDFPSTNYPLAGTYTNNYLNITYNPMNDLHGIIGNATYITSSENLPDEQESKIFLIEETEGCEDQLNNVTNATAVILIYDTEKGYEADNSSYANCTGSVIRVNSTENNLTQIKNMLENNTWMIADNYINETVLTFTYDLNNGTWYDYDFVILHSLIQGVEGTFFWETAFWWLLNEFWIFTLGDSPLCKGFIIYPDYVDDVHFMLYSNRAWRGYSYGRFESPGEELRLLPEKFPCLPTFSVNKSIGTWLKENRTDPDCTISGFLDQQFIEEDHTGETWEPGVEAYNVVGNISGQRGPEDGIILISNRFDGWWGETPGDSGAGAGIVLAVAKYMKENSIVPKKHVTFLMTTGEEYGKRGARHYSDSHGCSNFDLFIGTDQLGFNQEDSFMRPQFYNETMMDIAGVIADDTHYEEDTGYEYNSSLLEPGEYSSAEDDVWKNSCNDTIAFAKDEWDLWHMTGNNYYDGDSMSNTDRNDLNVTLRFVWNVTKYFVVDPDCWYENYEITSIDTDDIDELADTVNMNFTVNSVLPHDKLMIQAMIMDDENIVNSEYRNFTVNSTGYTSSIQVTLPDDCSPGEYNYTILLYNSTGRINSILNFEGTHYNISLGESYIPLWPYDYSLIVPDISNVSAVPDTVGFGFNVTISADVTSNVSDIDKAMANITSPAFSINSYNMTNTIGDTYEFVFNDTWNYGVYKFKIWAVDVNGNMSYSSQHVFNVTTEATISVCTIKDTYTGGEIVNLTDPPNNGGGSNPSIGYELLDDNKVLHVWNRFDSYYFNTSNGIQFTNHKDEYWSHNVLMLGYYNNDMWNLLYRTDELSGFNKKITSDNSSFVNATLWKDLSYGGYDFRLAIRYFLGVDDNELTVIPYIKNLDDKDIPYVLGFGWEIKDIQVDMTPSGDYIEINGTSYYLNQTLDETYTNLDDSCYYIKEDTGDTFESLYLRWDENLNYKVKVESRTGQYNAPVTLFIRIGTLNVDQEKFTSLFWHDASEIVYFFDGYIDGGWPSNPSSMVDGNESNYASTTIPGVSEHCDNNTCDDVYLGNISKVELRCKAYYTDNDTDVILQPLYNGTNPGDRHTFDAPEDAGGWSSWFDITSTQGSTAAWTWNKVENLDCYVVSSDTRDPFTLFCSKVEIRVTYTPKNASGISDPVPPDGSTGICIAPVLGITVSDKDGDQMNISWYSNSSGDWEVFGVNNSVDNGTYHQIMVNASVNGMWWYWNVSVDDGETVNTSDVFSFYTGYESKIQNTGGTNFSGFLLMQVEFYNTTLSEWVIELPVVAEKTPRVIGVGETLGLDTIFNAENVNTSMFSNGDGTYRVYAAFRDPDGDVLVCDDQSSMEDSYEFTVTYS